MEPQRREGSPALTFHWLDIERIAEELTDHVTGVDPLSVSFPKLRALVEGLEGFEEEEGHPCNERILEAIQQAWIEEMADGPAE